MDGYPLAEPPPDDRSPRNATEVSEGASLEEAFSHPHLVVPHHSRAVTRWGRLLRLVVFLGVLIAHALLSFACLGGWSEVSSRWPLAWHDHPMHYHNALVTRSFFVQNGTTAGYDPYFMSGYAKSIVSDPSGTMIEGVIAVFGRDRPAQTYKMLVLTIMVILPWLIALTIRLVGGGFDAVVAGTIAFLVYLWTDFPLEYAGFGMLAFLLVIPLGLVVLALVVRFLRGGGFVRWVLATVGSGMLIFVHPLAAQTVGPAVLAAYAAAVGSSRRSGERLPIGRHLGLLLIPLAVLAINAFWWLPGIMLRGTRDPDGADFFSHPEPVFSRIAQVFGLDVPAQPPIQIILLGGALLGLAALRKRCPLQTMGLGAFLVMGLFWGYFAGWFPAFNFLQPGRNTYAVYSAAAVASGLGWSALRRQLSRTSIRLGRWFLVATVLVSIRVFVPSMIQNIGYRTGREPVPELVWQAGELPRVRWFGPTGKAPFLSSRPTPELTWLLDQIQTHFEPGDRIYYEEGGEQRGDLTDPFGGHRYGGLLPSLARVEVIGGPFLNVPVRENFTQFGMGKLCGLEAWGREEFEQFSRLYGPEGIVCWSATSQEFCRSHPDLVEIVADLGTWLIAKVKGFEGDAIRGEARVIAEAGKLEVEPVAVDVDGMIVLRYHSVPGLRSDPPGLLREVEEPGDPVPFIGVIRPEGPLTIEWNAFP